MTMDTSPSHDWKKSVGFTINYSSHSSEEDFDNSDVVMRHPSYSSRYLLEDGGDGAEADILGTTPPRARIRDKEKRKNVLDGQLGAQRVLRVKKSEEMLKAEQASLAERRKKGVSLKLRRKEARDYKQDQAQSQPKADSLPSPGPQPAVPTLVESCNRFMSLTSRLKCPEEYQKGEEVVERGRDGDDELPENRVNFHKTFCLLINMGNIDKGCRRTISREEQVWQNELKDLIWLELQAKIAGRALADQDQFLCAQRDIVPTLVRNIIDYRYMNELKDLIWLELQFVSSNACRSRSRRLAVIEGSKEDLTADLSAEGSHDDSDSVDGASEIGCLSFNCEPCSAAVSKAMRELGTLLDSFYNALSLYPSSKAMTVDHPLIATQLFKNRIKAMCLWYNIALHMRMKMRGVRCMLRSIKMKSQRRGLHHRASTDSDTSRISSEGHRPCQVRFNFSNNPTDSSNSESSHSDVIKEEGEEQTDQKESDSQETNGQKEGHSDTGEQERNGEDEVDCRLRDQNGHITPEIVISDRYGTNDTASTESGYLSAGESEHGENVYDCGSLGELTQLRLLDKCAVSAYREYHQEMLKTQGVRRCMAFINKIRKNVLHKVYMTLQKSDSVETEANASDDATEVFEDTREEEERREYGSDEEALVNELKRYGCWSEECLAMRLPSYRNHFLLLSSICMEVVHDYLTLRLDGRPEHPSCLTVKQLIHELKEGLDIATEVRADFVKHVGAALADRPASSEAQEDLRTLIRTYDDTVETVLKQYLSYLMTMSETEQLSRACLQAEWHFTARLAKRVKCASLLAPDAFSKIACNQMDRVMKQFKAKSDSIQELIENGTEFNRELVYVICREVQMLYVSEREAGLQSVQWARALAARLARAPPPGFTKQRQEIFEKLMAIREFIVQHTNMVLEKSRFPDEEPPKEYNEGLVMRVRELLLQMFKLGFEWSPLYICQLHRELCKLSPASPEPLCRSRPSSLQPPRPAPLAGARRPRPETMLIHDSVNEHTIHKELHRFGNSSSTRSPFMSSRRSLLNSPPKFLRSKFVRSESINEDENSVLDDRLFDNLNADCHVTNSIELLLSGEEPKSEETVELRHNSSRASSEQRQWAAVVARAVIQFARCWMQFVVERCDRGRGLRPRWASQGLDFLMLACDPCNTKYLSEEEFKELEAQMDGCISHVVGSRRAPAKAELAPSSPRPARGRTRLHTPVSTSSLGVPPPPTPPTEPDPLLCFRGLEHTSHSKRVLEATARVDSAREESLRSQRAVGRVLCAAVHSYEPKLKQVTFKWQRGLKIGAGTFGKVYTVVNTESGQLLAMKELTVGVGDRRALQRAANELRVLEGIVHPHLVRYYGIELHREEMLLFMELCVEGSLETLVAGAGALPELTVRRYAKQLVSAVTELHARGVAHRDIKSGNIFLTNEGHCLKLGDFGCAVKIRANTTAPGELQGFVGTQAYMAPEVFMKGGHGRAADVWSLGCVVTEMASGKRPFAEYDSNYQIMFMVGMGGRPDIPDSLSAEGRQFCTACLTHDPDLRPKAEQLIPHHFLMIKSDEDCKCEPAFLIS